MKDICNYNHLVYSQLHLFAGSGICRGKGYEGYIFPKEHSLWGFPPEQNRYTPSSEEIALAEKF